MTRLLSVPSIDRRSFLKGVSGTALVLSGGTAVRAADWPARTVTIIVPYNAGGNSDILARLLVQYLTEKTGKKFIIENKPGGGGVAASIATAESRPDGCTVLFGPPAPFVVTPLLQSVGYSAESFTPINNFAGYPYLLGIKSALPCKTVADLIAYAKANPGKLNYATAGVGSMSHLVTALFIAKTGINAVMVPYKSSLQSTGAVMAGETDFVFSSTADLLPYLQSNERIRIIATTGEQRLPEFPDLPALHETVSGYSIGTWNGLVGPRGIPPEIVEKFSTLVREATNAPSIKDRLKSLGVFPIPSTSSEFAATIKSDKEFVSAGLKAAGLI